MLTPIRNYLNSCLNLTLMWSYLTLINSVELTPFSNSQIGAKKKILLKSQINSKTVSYSNSSRRVEITPPI